MGRIGKGVSLRLFLHPCHPHPPRALFAEIAGKLLIWRTQDALQCQRDDFGNVRFKKKSPCPRSYFLLVGLVSADCSRR